MRKPCASPLSFLGPSRTRAQFQICPGQIWLETGQWQKICPESYSRTWEQNLWTKHHTMLWASRNFPRSSLYPLFQSTNRDTRDLKMFPQRIVAIIFFFYFLVLHQQANININLMICCLLLMQNLRAQNILVTRCIRCIVAQRNS